MQYLLWAIPLMLVVLVFVLAWNANSAYDKFVAMREKYNEIKNSLGITAEKLGKSFSTKHFNGLIELQSSQTSGPDGTYIPRTHTVMLKEEFLNNTSIAAISILAHEFGHAIQHFQNPQILIKHQKLNNLVKFLGNLNPLIVILSIVLCISIGYIFALAGLGLIFINTIIAICLKAQTSHVEKNASQEALKILENFGFSKTDLAHAKKFLSYAKSTYTADFLCALLGWTGLTRKTNYF